MPKVKQPVVESKFMTQLRTKLITENKVAEGTANLYMTKLRKLNGGHPFMTFSFLKDTKGITALLDQYENDNTRKSYLASIIAVLNGNEGKAYKTVNSHYKAMMNTERKNMENKPAGEMSATQKENWMEWSEIKKIYEALKEKVEKYDKKILDDSVSARQIYQDFIVLSFYVLCPPRRNADYYLMKVDDNNNMNEDYNYYRHKEGKFIFNNYKTKKTHGVEVLEVNDTLKGVLNRYIQLMGIGDDEYLLFRNDTLRKSSSIITKTLNRILKRKVGSSMLRHIYLTSHYGNTYKELNKVAQFMGHSLEMASEYVLDA